MPAITTYTPQVSIQNPGQPRATADAFGAGVAQAQGQMAQQLGRVGNVAEKFAIDSQVLDWNKQVSQFKLDSMKRAQELSTASVPQGKTLTDLYNDDFDERAASLNIPPAVRSQAQEELNNMRVSYVGDGIREQAQRAGIAAKDNWNQTVTNYANMVALDPTKQDAALTQLAKAAGGLGTLAPEERTALFHNARQSIRGSAAQTLIQQNPVGFMSEAKAGKWNDLQDLPKYMTSAGDEMLKAQAAIDTQGQITDMTTSYNNPSVIFDPGSPQTKKIAGTVFATNGGLQALQQGQPDGANSLMQVVTRTGVIPENAQGTLRALMTAGNSQQKGYAYDVIGRLQEDAPMALSGFNPNEISQAVMYNDLTRNGMDQQSAMKYIKDAFDPLNKPVMELRQANVNDILKKNATSSNFADIFDKGVFDIGPDMPRNNAAADTMLAQYRDTLKTQYLMHGDENVAKQAATAELQRFYGVSKAAGTKTVMKYPPEKYYAIQGVDSDWMPNQLLDDVKKLPGQADVSLKNVELLPDTVTAADVSAGRLPRYQVMVNKDGIWDSLRDASGKTLYYSFDPQKEINAMSEKKKQERNDLLRKAQIIRGKAQLYSEIGPRGNPMPPGLLDGLGGGQ